MGMTYTSNDADAVFDISRDEFNRIANVAKNDADFVAIWEGESWWTDHAAFQENDHAYEGCGY